MSRSKWKSHVRETLIIASTQKKNLWISFNGESGFNGQITKVSDDVFTLTSEKGGTYHFFIGDVKIMYDNSTAAPVVKTEEFKGSN